MLFLNDQGAVSTKERISISTSRPLDPGIRQKRDARTWITPSWAPIAGVLVISAVVNSVTLCRRVRHHRWLRERLPLKSDGLPATPGNQIGQKVCLTPKGSPSGDSEGRGVHLAPFSVGRQLAFNEFLCW